MKKIVCGIVVLALVAGAGLAQETSYAQRVTCDFNVETDDGESVPLRDLVWLQGSTPLVAAEPMRLGQAIQADPAMTVRMLIAPTATGVYYAVTNAYLATNFSYYIQWPTIGTNSCPTNSDTARPWFYTILFEKNGRSYWTGNGDLYVKKTTATGTNGLVWQEIIAGAAIDFLARANAATALAVASNAAADAAAAVADAANAEAAAAAASVTASSAAAGSVYGSNTALSAYGAASNSQATANGAYSAHSNLVPTATYGSNTALSALGAASNASATALGAFTLASNAAAVAANGINTALAAYGEASNRVTKGTTLTINGVEHDLSTNRSWTITEELFMNWMASNITRVGESVVGRGTTGASQQSLAVGTNAYAEEYSCSIGDRSTADTSSAAFGRSTTGMHYSAVFGINCFSTYYSLAGGYGNKAYKYSLVAGHNNLSSNQSFSSGTQAQAFDYSIAVGNNCMASDHSVAFGIYAYATNSRSFVFSDGDASTSAMTNQIVFRAVNGFIVYQGTNIYQMSGGVVRVNGDIASVSPVDRVSWDAAYTNTLGTRLPYTIEPTANIVLNPSNDWQQMCVASAVVVTNLSCIWLPTNQAANFVLYFLSTNSVLVTNPVISSGTWSTTNVNAMYYHKPAHSTNYTLRLQ